MMLIGLKISCFNKISFHVITCKSSTSCVVVHIVFYEVGRNVLLLFDSFVLFLSFSFIIAMNVCLQQKNAMHHKTACLCWIGLHTGLRKNLNGGAIFTHVQ